MHSLIDFFIRYSQFISHFVISILKKLNFYFAFIQFQEYCGLFFLSMNVENDTIRPSDIFTDTPSARSDERLDKIKKKLIKQQHDIALREKVALNFNFDKSWRRTKYVCYTVPDKELNNFYLEHTFDNQNAFGNDIADTFRERNVTHVLAIAPTLSG